MTASHKPWGLVIAIGLFLVAGPAGCSSGASVLPDDRDTVNVPESFADGGRNWKTAGALTESDVRRLTGYFTRHPSVAEHSIVQGDPQIYAAGDLRRYYWIRPGMDGAEWLCLQFGDRSVQLQDGSGAPFLAEETR